VQAWRDIEIDKSENSTAQVNGPLANIVAYNLTAVTHEMYENGINPDFLQIKSIIKGTLDAKPPVPKPLNIDN